MANLKITTYAVCIALTAGLMSSCNNDDVEVIEQDTSWTIDQGFIDDDIREHVGGIPTTDLVFLHSKLNTGDGIHEEGKTTLSFKDKILIKAGITRGNTKDITVSLVVDEERLDASKELLPSTSYQLESAIIKAGELTTNLGLTFTNPDVLKGGSYALPLNLAFEEIDGVGLTTNSKEYLLSLVIYNSLANISFGNKPEGETSNENVKLNSNVNSYNLHYLVDGELGAGSSWWSQSWEATAANHYLEISPQDNRLIKGIQINSENLNKRLTEVRIWVENDGGIELHGDATVENDGLEQYLLFEKPISSNMIRLTNLKSGTSNKVSLTEIQLIY